MSKTKTRGKMSEKNQSRVKKSDRRQQILLELKLRPHVRITELAQRFNCVPSQINYVMSTRFSPERGYIVESRRGGNGYIRITRVQVDRQTLMMHVINSLGSSVDLASARAILSNLVQSGALERDMGQTILTAVGDKALSQVPRESRDAVRADILRQVLILQV